MYKKLKRKKNKNKKRKRKRDVPTGCCGENTRREIFGGGNMNGKNIQLEGKQKRNIRPWGNRLARKKKENISGWKRKPTTWSGRPLSRNWVNDRSNGIWGGNQLAASVVHS